MQKSEIMLLAKCKSLEEVREILGLMLELQHREENASWMKEASMDAMWSKYLRNVSECNDYIDSQLDAAYEDELHPHPWDAAIRESRDQIWEEYEGTQDNYLLRCKLITLQNQKNVKAGSSRLGVSMINKVNCGVNGFVPMLLDSSNYDQVKFRKFIANVRYKISNDYEIFYYPEEDEWYTWFPMSEWDKVYNFLFVTLGKYFYIN